MKKTAFLLSSLIIAGSLVSCDKEDNTLTVETERITNGLYIINNGNMSTNIPSSITAYNFDNETGTPSLEDAFLKANGIELGEGARPAIIYDSKMYIPMTDSNLVWVVNPNTLKVINRISFEGEANSPREIIAADGKIYVSMFSGYVCQIDPKKLTVDKTIKTGPNAEQMAVAGGKLYVANSDGYNYTNGYVDGSISIIDLKSFTETKIKDISKVMNPTDMVSNGEDVFVICKGDYATVPSTVKKIVGNDVIDVAPGNYMAIDGDKLYVINNVYGVPREDMGFNVYNTKTLENKGLIARQTEGTESWVDSPCYISVNPKNGDIVILSYTLSDAGWSQYSEPGYANLYDRDGNFKQRISCGVGSLGVTFVNK